MEICSYIRLQQTPYNSILIDQFTTCEFCCLLSFSASFRAAAAMSSLYSGLMSCRVHGWAGLCASRCPKSMASGVVWSGTSSWPGRHEAQHATDQKRSPNLWKPTEEYWRDPTSMNFAWFYLTYGHLWGQHCWKQDPPGIGQGINTIEIYWGHMLYIFSCYYFRAKHSTTSKLFHQLSHQTKRSKRWASLSSRGTWTVSTFHVCWAQKQHSSTATAADSKKSKKQSAAQCCSKAIGLAKISKYNLDRSKWWSWNFECLWFAWVRWICSENHYKTMFIERLCWNSANQPLEAVFG